MTQLSLFDPMNALENNIRKATHNGETYYSLVDICGQITGTQQARAYWRDTKKRLKKDGFQLEDKISQLKLPAADGKKYATDCATAKTCFRIMQTIPHAGAEPIRQWLAQLAHERLEETANPELGMQRSERRYLDNQQKRGMTEAQALQALADRRDGKRDFRLLMEAVQAVCIDNPNYGALVNTEYRELFGMVASQLKAVLETDSIRDALPPLQYSYIRTAELNMRELLKASDRLTFEQVQRGMKHICTPLGQHLREMCEIYQIDHVTGRPLLAGGVQ